MCTVTEELQAHDFQAGAQRPTRPSMAFPACFQPLVDHEAQCFVGGRQHRYRQLGGFRCIVFNPLFRESRQVQVQALRATASRGQRVTQPVRERHQRQPRRTPQALLQATHRRVERPAIEVDRASADAQDRVGHKERAGVAARAANGFERLQDAARRVSVYDGHDSGRVAPDSGGHVLAINGVTPGFRVDAFDRPAVKGRQRAQQLTKVAVHPDQHPVTRADQTGQYCLDARARRARDSQRARAAGTKHRPRQLCHLVQ